jgi:septum formation protein
VPIRIILASGSHNRSRILESLGVKFEAVPSNVDERSVHERNLVRKAEKIAQLKARAVASEREGIIIAADTFGVLNGSELQKPKDLYDAHQMLKKESGKKIKIITGMCVIDTRNGKETKISRTAFVRCKKLTDAEIDHYIKTRPVTEWAGAYNPQDKASSKLFAPVSKYAYGMERFSLPIDVLASTLKSVGTKIDITDLKALPEE